MPAVPRCDVRSRLRKWMSTYCVGCSKCEIPKYSFVYESVVEDSYCGLGCLTQYLYRLREAGTLGVNININIRTRISSHTTISAQMFLPLVDTTQPLSPDALSGLRQFGAFRLAAPQISQLQCDNVFSTVSHLAIIQRSH